MDTNNLKQPPSLRIFFATEMWERYGFYVIQTLLALYLTQHFEWEDRPIYDLVASFTAITYLSPIIGGFIADHLLGQKRSILAGILFLFVSYGLLTIVASETALIMALTGIAVGTGLLKPNISSLLGNEYPTHSPLRENGFTIFYLGITLGIILGTTLPSQLNYWFGWSISFFSAAFGLIIAFVVFVFGIQYYRIADYRIHHYHPIKILKALGLITALWFIAFNILANPRFANILFGLVVIISIAYMVKTVKSEPKEQARKTLVIGLLCIISIMFWAFYFQMFLSLTLFLARAVNPCFLGMSFPPPYYVAIQSLGMLIFGYILTRKPSKIDTFNQRFSVGDKFFLAMIFMLIAYTLITRLCYSSTDAALLSPLWFMPAYLLIAIAELYLSPVGLAAITTLANRAKVSTMMGIFFVSLGLGGFLSGKLANLTAVVNPSKITTLAFKLHYAKTFGFLLMILIICTILCFILNRFITRLLRS